MHTLYLANLRPQYKGVRFSVLKAD